MKQIKDIEKMDWQELEATALQENVPIPPGFRNRLEDTLAAKRILEKGTKEKGQRLIILPAIAAAAAMAAILLLPHGSHEPEDTFDDPRLAYAAVEKTFQFISTKMSKSLEMADEARAMAEKPVQILKNQKK